MKKLIINITRVIFSIISVLTGVSGAYFFLYDIIPYKYLILTMSFIVVVIWELATLLFLNDFFKKLFNEKKFSFVFLILSIIFYSGSFFISVNGISFFVENTKDKTILIENNNNKNVDSIVINFNQNKIKIEKKIDSLNKLNFHYAKWESRRDEKEYLLNQLIYMQNEKDSLLKKNNCKSKEKIKENIELVSVKKKEYYYATSVIIFIIIILNFTFNFLNIEKEFLEENKDYLKLQKDFEFLKKESENDKEKIQKYQSDFIKNSQLKKDFEILMKHFETIEKSLSGRIKMNRENLEKKQELQTLLTELNTLKHEK